MFKVKKIFLFILQIICLLNFVANLAASQQELMQAKQIKPERNWHTYAYTGYAWSQKAGIVNPDPAVFANVASGDTDNANLANTSFAGLSLHYNASNSFTLGFSFEKFGTFTYQKYHLNGNPMREGIGPSYVRQFLLNHQAAMLEARLKMPDHLSVELGYIKVMPLVMFGIGVGINNVYNFATISYNPDLEQTAYTSIANNNISTCFAWHIETGLDFASLLSDTAFGVSYRYDYGGKFASGTLYEFASGMDALTYLPAWRGTLKTNQIKLYINVNFD